MIFIGESINATIPQVNQAITQRDKPFITELAKAQCDAGADYIDINAGTGKGDEAEDLVFLTELVQQVSNKPLCLDSSDPNALRSAASRCREPFILNSVSADKHKLSDILPIIDNHACRVIALSHGEGGIPETLEERLHFARTIVDELRHAGLKDDAIFLDPVLMGLSTDFAAGATALDAIKVFRREYKNIHIILPLSNISFGLPGRSVVNNTFMSMTAAAGVDSYILDVRKPAYAQLKTTLNLLLGQDKYCKHYIKAYRQGLFN